MLTSHFILFPNFLQDGANHPFTLVHRNSIDFSTFMTTSINKLVSLMSLLAKYWQSGLCSRNNQHYHQLQSHHTACLLASQAASSFNACFFFLIIVSQVTAILESYTYYDKQQAKESADLQVAIRLKCHLAWWCMGLLAKEWSPLHSLGGHNPAVALDCHLLQVPILNQHCGSNQPPKCTPSKTQKNFKQSWIASKVHLSCLAHASLQKPS